MSSSTNHLLIGHQVCGYYGGSRMLHLQTGLIHEDSGTETGWKMGRRWEATRRHAHRVGFGWMRLVKMYHLF